MGGLGKVAELRGLLRTVGTLAKTMQVSLDLLEKSRKSSDAGSVAKATAKLVKDATRLEQILVRIQYLKAVEVKHAKPK